MGLNNDTFVNNQSKSPPPNPKSSYSSLGYSFFFGAYFLGYYFLAGAGFSACLGALLEPDPPTDPTLADPALIN